MATIGALLRGHGIDRSDASILLAHVLGTTRVVLATHPERGVPADLAGRFHDLVERRARGEPVAYLVGDREFYGLALRVTPAVLIPRPETELLVELAVALIGTGPARALDLGTGSGAIAVAVAHECPAAEVWAADRSEAALAVARENASRHGVRVRLVASDWFDAPDGALRDQAFDLILANPPYVAEGDPHLDEGDLRYEPAIALACGSDGLDAIRILVAQAPAHLRDSGVLALEHGYDQAGAVRELMTARGFTSVETQSDLQGHGRMTHGRWHDPDDGRATATSRSKQTGP